MTQFDLRLEAVGKSDRGVKRTNNEDAFAIHLPDDERPDALFMVADGIGGLSKGEIASRLTLETILGHYFSSDPEPESSGKLDPGARLLGALQVANQEVLAKAMADMDRMGSTVAGILIDFRRQATIFNVGDSRVYRIRNRAITQLSQDQVLDIPAAPSEKNGTPKRTSKLLFFIGQNRPLEPYFERFTVQPGDSFVLCSDGLWSLVKSQEILDAVSAHSAQNAADHLIDLARQRGAPDNVTVVIIHTRELRNNALLPLAVGATVVIALAAVGFVFLQSRNPSQDANLVQTEAVSTMSALQSSATLTLTNLDTLTRTHNPPTLTPSASFTVSPAFTPTINTTETEQAALQATASADAQVATDSVSTISAAAIATSGAQATGTMQEAQIGTRVAGTQTAIASFTPSFVPSATSAASFTPNATPTLSAQNTQTSSNGATLPATNQPLPTANTLPPTVTLADGTVLPVNPDITYQLFSGTRKIYNGPGSRYGLVTEIASGVHRYPVLARLTGSFLWYVILLPDNSTGWIAVPSDDNFARIDVPGANSLVQIPKLPEPSIPTITNTPTKVQ